MRTPHVPEASGLQDPDFLSYVKHLIKERATDPQFNVPLLAEALQLTTKALCQKLKALSGELPGELIRTERLRYASVLLRQSTHSLKNIATMSGFFSYQGFWRSFSSYYGLSPSAYRFAGQSEEPTRQVKWVMPPTFELREALMNQMRIEPWLSELLRSMLDRLKDGDTTLEDLASPLHVSPSQLTKRLKKVLNITPMRLLLDMRLLYSAELLMKPDVSVSSIAYSSGFFDQPHFSKAFVKAFRCSPRVYRVNKMNEGFYSWLVRSLGR